MEAIITAIIDGMNRAGFESVVDSTPSGIVTGWYGKEIDGERPSVAISIGDDGTTFDTVIMDRDGNSLGGGNFPTAEAAIANVIRLFDSRVGQSIDRDDQ